MPPLHRMPIVYLAAALILATLGFARAVGHRTKPAAASVSTTGSPSAPPVVAATSAVPIAAAQDDGILRTTDGLRRKVLIRALGVLARVQPQGPPAGSAALDYFSIHYVYGETPPDSARWFRIGTRDGSPEGWVPAEDVLEWTTRLVATPTPRGDRPALVLYREKTCLLAALSGETCPDHGKACPVEGREGDSSGAAAFAGWPILRSESIPDPAGSPRTIFEVASLVEDQAPSAPPARLPAETMAALRRIDVALVLDTTASMQASLEAARRLAADLVAETARRYRDVTLRFALVEYRDSAPAYGYQARITAPFTDAGGFHRALAGVTVARAGDGSVDEQVLDGIEMALPPDPSQPARGRHLAWPSGRAGELATKLVILVGDAPDHDRTAERAEALAARASRQGITIAAVRIARGDRSRDEEARYRQQWLALADGSYRPLDRAAGFSTPLAPLVIDLAGADQLVGRLQALLDDRVDAARQRAALAAAEAENRLEAYVTRQGLTLRQIHPVLVDLHRGEPTPQPRPDPRAGGRKAPSVRKGWIAPSLDGAPMVRVDVLMSRSELDALIGELLAVQQAAQGSARSLSDLLQIGTAAAAGETEFLAADRGATTFAEHLRRRQGLPPARPDSLLRTTQNDLLQADDLTRAAIDQRLGATIGRLIQRRAEIDWDDPRRTLDGLAPVPYDWIDY